jgi:hypothetical protein
VLSRRALLNICGDAERAMDKIHSALKDDERTAPADAFVQPRGCDGTGARGRVIRRNPQNDVRMSVRYPVVTEW